MSHIDLRHYFETPGELYAHLYKNQTACERRIGWWMTACGGLLIAGLYYTASWWHLYLLAMSVQCGIMSLWEIGDLVARNWFMHYMTLHSLIHPKKD